MYEIFRIKHVVNFVMYVAIYICNYIFISLLLLLNIKILSFYAAIYCYHSGTYLLNYYFFKH